MVVYGKAFDVTITTDLINKKAEELIERKIKQLIEQGVIPRIAKFNMRSSSNQGLDDTRPQ